MNTVISATEARKRFFEIIDWARQEGREIIIEKDGSPAVKISSAKEDRSPEEVKKILREFRGAMKPYRKRKYWSVLETPAWKKKDQKYMEDLAKGILR